MVEKIILPGGNEEILRVSRDIDLETMDRRVEITIPFCKCGQPLRESIERCSECGGLVCESCRVKRNRETICRDCLSEPYDLDEVDVKILLCIEENIYSHGKMARLIGVTKGEVERRIEQLKNPLIRVKKRDTFWGTKTVNHKLTAEGREILDLWKQVYSKRIQKFSEEVAIEGVLR